MSEEKKSFLKCPKCGTAVSIKSISEKGNFFPFCSERCKMVDLGAWLDNDYAIAAQEPLDSDIE
ncbi:MAG: DNA gyrase inhibitor YacG [Sedimentisphaeraceae bacterium JB056]